MSDDLPLARAPGRLSAAEGVEPHAWARYHWLWELYYAVAGLFTLAAIVGDRAPVANRIVAAALLCGLAVWYVGYGRPLLRALHRGEPTQRRALLYQAGTLALFVPAVLLAESSVVALIGLIALAYQTMTLLLASITTLLLFAAGIAPQAMRAGEIRPVLTALPAVALVFVCIVASSAWIRRIIEQSVERADLAERLAAAQQEVSRLSHEAGVAAERQRLAGDLHDTVAQGLSSVVMLVQAADAALERDPAQARTHLALAQRTARENLAEARALVAALTPAELDGSPLPEALARLATRATTRTTVAVTGTPRSLPTALEVVLLRAAQEALTNLDKHASATQASLDLTYGPDAVVLAVADDGCGFAPDRPSGGYGLAAMRARAEQVGATVTVDSGPGAGTTVRVRVPT